MGALRAHGVVEHPAIPAADQAVVTGRLDVPDPDGQIVFGRDLRVHHRTVDNRRADDGAVVLAEEIQQQPEVGPCEEPGATRWPASAVDGLGRDGRPRGARVRGVGQVLLVHHDPDSRRPHSSCANRSSNWSRVAARRRPTAWRTRGYTDAASG